MKTILDFAAYNPELEIRVYAVVPAGYNKFQHEESYLDATITHHGMGFIYLTESYQPKGNLDKWTIEGLENSLLKCKELTNRTLSITFYTSDKSHQFVTKFTL